MSSNLEFEFHFVEDRISTSFKLAQCKTTSNLRDICRSTIMLSSKPSNKLYRTMFRTHRCLAWRSGTGTAWRRGTVLKAAPARARSRRSPAPQRTQGTSAVALVHSPPNLLGTLVEPIVIT